MFNKYSVATLIAAASAAPSSDQDYSKFPAFGTPVPITTANGLDATTGAVTGTYVGAITTGTKLPGYGPLRGLRNQVKTFPTQTSFAIGASSTASTAAVITPAGTTRTFW